MASTNTERGVANRTTFMSYNSTGMNSAKSEWTNKICNKYDVNYLSIQEHFKSCKSTDKYFKDSFKEFFSYVIPGHRPPGQDNGRAKGGLAQLSRKNIPVKKDRVPTRTWRLQAQILNFSSTRILWINSYLPTDPQRADYDTTELLEILGEVEILLTSIQFNDVVWAGDLNWDMTRNSNFAKVVRGFVQRMGLAPLWEYHPIDFSHIHTDNRSISTIDHFLISPRLLSLVTGCGVVHVGDNMSRHSPIWISLDLGSLPARKPTKSKSERKPAWSKATPEDIKCYTTELKTKLGTLSVPSSLSCNDPLCTLY